MISAQTLATETAINLTSYAMIQIGISLLAIIVQVVLSFLVMRQQRPHTFNWFHWFVAFFLLFLTIMGGQDTVFFGGTSSSLRTFLLILLPFPPMIF